MINRDEVNAWRVNLVTDKLISIIKQAKELSTEQLLYVDPEKTHERSELVGFIKGLNLVLEAELEDTDET